MSKKIKILIYRTGENPELAEIDTKKKTMKNIVGGRIDNVLLCTNNIMLICSEESLIKNLPKSIAFGYTDKQGLLERKKHKGIITSIIHGNCFFCSYDNELQACSLTDEQIELLKKSIYVYKECNDGE